MKKLTAKQEKFALEFAINGNASESYRIAYDASRMSVKSVGRKACELKVNPAVAARIKELKQAAFERAEIKATDIVKMWIKIAMADPNDLVQIRRVACPECFGERVLPHSDCVSCRGGGVEQLYVADTRQLNDSAKLLFNGARQTKYGIEVILRDRDAALNSLAKFLGVFKESKENTVSPKVLEIPLLSSITTDPVEASRIYQEIMRGD